MDSETAGILTVLTCTVCVALHARVVASVGVDANVCIQCTDIFQISDIVNVKQPFHFKCLRPSLLQPLRSICPSLPPSISCFSHSLSVLCYRWQSSCLWCLAGEPGPAVSACSARGHCSLVPGGLLALSGLPNDPQSPQFPP